MTLEEFKKKMKQLVIQKQLAMKKDQDTKLIDIEMQKIRHEYAKSLFEEMNENGKYKKQ